MSGIGYLALRHILFHRLRSLTLVLVMATLITIPMLAEVLTRAAETRMMARAEATPMIYGATGAPLNLTLSVAYFRGDVDTLISMADYEWLLTTRQADLAPIHHAGTTSGFPIIGTDIDYFRLRGLTPIKGRLPVRICEAVLGADVAERLGVGVGDTFTSDVQQVFNLAGAYGKIESVSVDHQHGGSIVLRAKHASFSEKLEKIADQLPERKAQRAAIDAHVIEMKA